MTAKREKHEQITAGKHTDIQRLFLYSVIYYKKAPFVCQKDERYLRRSRVSPFSAFGSSSAGQCDGRKKLSWGNGSKNNLLYPVLWDTTGCFIVYTIFGWVSRIQRLHCDP